jgi:hypothetical protein
MFVGADEEPVVLDELDGALVELVLLLEPQPATIAAVTIRPTHSAHGLFSLGMLNLSPQVAPGCRAPTPRAVGHSLRRRAYFSRRSARRSLARRLLKSPSGRIES